MKRRSDLLARQVMILNTIVEKLVRHHIGRQFRSQGHDVRPMSPEYVRPYVKAHKNDDRDAEGIVEAATRPTMRFVDIKEEEQLDMQTLHRARDRLVGERTALINHLRAILLERVITVPQGRRKLEIWLDLDTDEERHSLSRHTVALIAVCGHSGVRWIAALPLLTKNSKPTPGLIKYADSQESDSKRL